MWNYQLPVKGLPQSTHGYGGPPSPDPKTEKGPCRRPLGSGLWVQSGLLLLYYYYYYSSGVLLVLNQAKAPFWVSHPIDTSISSANIINAKQGFEGSLISRNVELSPQKPLKRSSDLQGWSVAEQYIDRARSESRLTTMTSFETNLKKD